ncbi:glycosyltransferase [Vagococcus fluvialis]|uniref:glycosyltransferase n=1 Tax=Vagococcus fluvialis TaxID=2738 RepID=UPI001D09C873|nr:glycosyltransferase [Vagococcus fluvialis]UDM78998.1 CDP-glycerol glycerophosphotransferase family protein [Vagococcus fluvialis]
MGTIRKKSKEYKKFLKEEVKFQKQPKRKKLRYYYKKIIQSPIVEDAVLLESYHAENCTGNVYAIYNELVETKPNMKKYWVYKKKDSLIELMTKDKNTFFIEHESYEYFKILSTAKYLINDTSFFEYFIKREDQVYVNTWHGTPLKTLGKDIINSGIASHKNIQRNILSTDYLIMPNEFTANKMIKSYDVEGILNSRVFVTGQPRVDNIFKDREEMRKKYNLPNAKIILYAPTWKKTVEETTEEDILNLVLQVEQLQQTVSKDTVIQLKTHYFIYEKFVSLGLEDKVVPYWVDTNEYLTCVDRLITDYSSIFFDFLPLGRPIYFFMDDLREYQFNRGLYLDVEDLPGHVYQKFEDLVEAMLISEKEYLLSKEKEYLTYMKNYCYLDNGEASKRALEIIFDENYVGKKELKFKSDKKVLMFYSGGLYNNGITNSLLNLCDNINYDKYEIILFEFDNFNRSEVKRNNLKRLNKNVRLVFHFGMNPTSVLDNINKNLLLRRGYYGKSINLDRAFRFFDMDLQRLLGNTEIDTLIDYGGYNRVINTMFASVSKVKNKIVFLHAIMENEYNKIVNGKYIHKYNLDVIFSQYHRFQFVASVSESANEVNSAYLTKINQNLEIDKMSYIENIIDGDFIISQVKSASKIDHEENNDTKNILIEKKEITPVKYTKTLIRRPESSEINFVYVARTSPEKNHELLLQAFNEIYKKNNLVRLHLVGDGPLTNQLKNLVNELGLQESVYFYGHLSKPYYFISACDCLLLYSDGEGQGMSLMEGMVLGLTVVGTNVPGIKSVINEQNGGLLVEPTLEGMILGMESYINGSIRKSNFDYTSYNNNIMTKIENVF